MAQFEDLVPDILFLLLLNASNLQVLWRLIRASASMYRVFRIHRDAILSTVVAREIGAGIMIDAAFALNSSRFCPRGASRAQAFERIKKYHADRTSNTTPSGASLGPEALSLLRAHQDVKFIAELFIGSRLPIVNSALENLESTKLITQEDYDLRELSSTEEMRLHRAIYRYAIFGNLFYYDSNRLESFRRGLAYAQDQSHSFLTLFPAWQVEELSCINDFVYDKILEKWQEAEEMFYSALKNDLPSWDLDNDDSNIIPFKVGEFFSHSVREMNHAQWRRYCATLSLSELREIFTAKDETILQVLKKHAHHSPLEFLSEALNEEPFHSTYVTDEYEAHQQALERGVKVRFREDSLDQPNEAWLWAHQYHPCDLYAESTGENFLGEGLRRFGYVFWDSSRLHDSGFLQKEMRDIALAILPKYPRPEITEDSVEVRLRRLAHSLKPPLEQ